MTHVLVMNRDLVEREGWIAESLFDAFVEAQGVANQLCQGDPKCLSVMDAVFVIQQQHACYGPTPYTHGLSANRKGVDAFIRYAYEQGYTSRLLTVDELFAPNTVSS